MRDDRCDLLCLDLPKAEALRGELPAVEDLEALAARMKALADPTRLRIVDAVRKAAPEAICQCELTPLFHMSQPALSKHLKVLIGAGVLGAEKRGLWTYYYERPEAREELMQWLS